MSENTLLPNDTLTPMVYLSILVLCVEEEGLDPKPMLRAIGVDATELGQPEGKIAADKMAEFVVLAERLIPEPEFWFLYGEKLTIATHGTLGYALMACQNLGQVLSFFTRYYHIQIPTLSIQSWDDDEFIILDFERNRVLPSNIGYDNEVIYSALYTNLKILLNNINFPVIFCFESDKPNLKYLASYHKHLGENIQFGCAISQIKFAKKHLQHPIVFSNPLMRSYYEEQCKQQLNRLLLSEDPIITVRQLLTATPGYFPVIGKVASLMNISERTLRRRLKQKNTSYREILDDTKLQQVIDLLKNTSLSIEHIAELMSYSDPANFRRAFKKWTSISPAMYRQNVYYK